MNRVRLGTLLALGAIAAAWLSLAGVAGAVQLPSGFRDDVVFKDLEAPTTLRFSPDGRVFVAEQTGEILVFSNLADTTPTVFADIRTQVYDKGDRGLLGLALDPGFPARPYLYALYTYDHVLGEGGKAPRWGQPDHSGDACEGLDTDQSDDCPVSGRLVRLTAVGDHAAENGKGEVEEDVLVEDWCQQYSSHSIGDLQFDAAGNLYASGGDGASFYDPDVGETGWPQKNQCGDPPGAVGTELSGHGAEGGALRAQDVRTPGDPTGLDGSIIRISPDSGAGVAGNPMSASPDANARRIIAFGFRNPFRFTIDPVSQDVYTGNVGWNTYEEIDHFPSDPAVAYNSGWPCYEGPGPNPLYFQLELNLCKDLYNEDGPEEAHAPFFLYRHAYPAIPGDPCYYEGGSAVSGMTFYEGSVFPAAYHGALFFADSVRGCIYVMFPDEDGEPDPLSTTAFLSEGGDYPGVDIEPGPEGDLYYAKLFSDDDGGTIHRISYDPHSPLASLTANPPWGGENLEVKLDASGSSDPDGEALSFKWDLDGDGTFETNGSEVRTKTFSGHNNVEVAVKVSDGTGKSNIARVTVYPGDTPPEPFITSPLESLTWEVGQGIQFSGFAADQQQGTIPDAGLYWKARLYHCPGTCHAHPLQVFPGVESGFLRAPDHDYPSHLEISLTATDNRGLSVTRSVSIYPRTVDLTLDSDAPGTKLGAGLLLEPAPFVLRAIEGARVLLSAPPTAEIGGREYAWRRWSDGGDRIHTVIAEHSATYRAIYGPDPATSRPQTRLRKRPRKQTHGRNARFVFAADQPGAKFECRLDKARFKPCHSPRVYKHLRPGHHSFRVRAINDEGRKESQAAAFSWTVVARPGRSSSPGFRP